MSHKRILALSLLLTSVWGAVARPLPIGAEESSKSSAVTKKRDSLRLSADVVPEKYDLFFEPDFEHAEFEGSETIVIKLVRGTKTIVLHARDLSVYDASVARRGGKDAFVKLDIALDRDSQMLTLSSNSLLPQGDYDLAIKFRGKLSEKLAGFYMSSFKDKSGKEQRIATTQMEPTDARRMFPCFDEPALKAKFKVSAAIPENMVAVSNGAVEFERFDARSGKKIVSFKTTPPFSTYLFALVIGDFKASRTSEVAGKKIRVFAPSGKEELTEFALEVAERLLPYYQKYFGFDYPLEKLDLIAIPDFSAGAMENPGAITFRESALLVDKGASLSTRMNVAGIVAHEMAHLWFGDLVTMKWWNDLWLNEAFATWMATKALEALYPEWRPFDEFSLSRVATLEADGLLATRAVEYPVKTPEDAMEMFDEITYEKGGSLLRMLETYLSESVFQAGIQQYMKDFAFGNAGTDDLWQALSNAARKSGQSGIQNADVKALMQSWVFEKGCPVVSFDYVTEKSKQDNQSISLNLSQNRYLRTGQSEKSKSKETIWQIPLNVRLAPDANGGRSLQPVLFSTPVASKKLNALPLFVNGTGCGFFRTRYDAVVLDNLLASKIEKMLNCQERVSLYSDLHALAVCGSNAKAVGVENMKGYINALTQLKADQDPYVLSLLIGQTAYFNDFIAEGQEEKYAEYVRSLLKPHLSRLGFERKESDSELLGQLRGRLVMTLGTIGKDTDCIEFCRTAFANYISDETTVDPDLRQAVAHVNAFNGEADEYSRLLQSVKLSKNPEAYYRNLGALASFRGENQIDYTLNMVLSKDVRAQDGPRILSRLLGNKAARAACWRFIQSNWSKLEAKFDDKHLPDLIESCAVFTEPAELESLQHFVEAHPLKNGRRSVAKTLEIVSARIKFKEGAKDGALMVFRDALDQKTN